MHVSIVIVYKYMYVVEKLSLHTVYSKGTNKPKPFDQCGLIYGS